MDKIEILIKHLRQKIYYSTHETRKQRNPSVLKQKKSNKKRYLAPFAKDIFSIINNLKFVQLNNKF